MAGAATPEPPERSTSVVVDLGTSSTKAGWSDRAEPDLNFPSVIGRGRHNKAMKALGLKDSYVGRHAQTLQGILSLRSPIKQGCVQHWDDLETMWEYIWDREVILSGVGGGLDPSDHQVLLSVPPLCSPKDWRKLTEMLLEGAGVGGVYLANKTVLSMYGGGRTTGICVDSGEDMTYIVPCWEGTPLPNATLIQKLGGKHITDRLLGQLANGKYSFPDDTFLLWKRSGKKNKSNNKFCVASRRDIVQEAKERFCAFSERPIKEGDSAFFKLEDEQVMRLPDGNMVVVGEESMTAPELMFQPSLVKKSYAGLHELVMEAVGRCEEKLRQRLLSNIVLSGGNSLIPGMDKRLTKELSQVLPQDMKVRVQAQPGRENFSWMGGVHLTKLDSFQRLWLTKTDYMEVGATLDVQEDTVVQQPAASS